jgi:stearoyl-CoA desaturase (Delta-9 desaturase)
MTTQVLKRPNTVPSGRNDATGRALVLIFVLVPTAAIAGIIPMVWGWGVNWHDLVLGAVAYIIPCLGIAAGYHRAFAHPSWKPVAPLKWALAFAGSLAIEGPVLVWAADHRRHHKYSDQVTPAAIDSMTADEVRLAIEFLANEGDPHSPWRFGTDWKALVKGLWFAHMGWILEKRPMTNIAKFAADLKGDLSLRIISNLFGLWVFVSLAAPTVAGYFWGGESVHAAITAFFWAGLVRVGFMHHVTWSINSVCHVFGHEDFVTGTLPDAEGRVDVTSRHYVPADHSRNVGAWLAIPSGGEANHNGHHAFPNSYRHGLIRGQIDIAARFIWVCAKLGLASGLQLPSPEELRQRHTGTRPIKKSLLRPPRPLPAAA